jgi:hypothetical protein
MTSGIAVWSQVTFLARYPEFTAACNANPSLYQSYFNEAGFYLSNTPTSRVQDVNRRLLLLNMITAHIAFLAGQLNTDGQARPVGRVSQASEGSVSATFDMNPQTPGSGPWFQQSQYGAAFWQATSRLRGAAYVPGLGPFIPGPFTPRYPC